MLRHDESIQTITETRVVPTKDFLTFEIDYVTPGGIHKTLHIAHHAADRIRNAVVSAVEAMPPAARAHSLTKSAQRK